MVAHIQDPGVLVRSPAFSGLGSLVPAFFTSTSKESGRRSPGWAPCRMGTEHLGTSLSIQSPLCVLRTHLAHEHIILRRWGGAGGPASDAILFQGRPPN